jgi:hypothetical protein
VPVTPYLLIGDESDSQPSEYGEYFVYGAIAVPVDSVPRLHEEIKRIRDKYGYKKEEAFKFDTRSKPGSSREDFFKSQQDHKQAKDELFDVLDKLNCTFFGYLFPHNIAELSKARKFSLFGKSKDANKEVHDRNVIYAMNTILLQYQKFLVEKEDWGLVMVDQPPLSTPGQQKQYFENKFIDGLSDITGQQKNSLDRIKIYGITFTKASYLLSAVDIATGTLRYLVNKESPSPDTRKMCCNILAVAWKKRKDNTIDIFGYGLRILPDNTKTIYAQQKKDQARDRINRHFQYSEHKNQV